MENGEKLKKRKWRDGFEAFFFKYLHNFNYYKQNLTPTLDLYNI